jgi:AcrR family transcriptional regulator
MSTRVRPTKAYHHGDLRTALLQAASRMLENEGLESLALREVARRAGVSHNAPYRHFPQREALLAALAAEGFAQLGQAQQKAAAVGGLRGMGEAYVQFALEHPQRFRLMFGGQVQIAKHPALREVAGRMFDRLSGALAERVPEAEGARDSSIAAWALVHGLALLLLDDRIATPAVHGKAGRDRAQFVRDVLGAVRFAGRAAQPR